MNEATPALAPEGLDQSSIRRIVVGVMLAMPLAVIDQTIVATRVINDRHGS